MSYVEDGCYDTCLDVPHVHGGKLIAIPGGNGPPGVQGPPGPPGVSDVPGPTGPVGATGPAGPTGDPGPAGPASTVPGPTGPQGVTGEQGQPGVSLDIEGTVPTYSDLPADPPAGSAWVVAADGLLYFFDGTAFPADGAGVPFRGPQGVQGIQGVPGASVTGPAGAPGATGPTGPTAVSADAGNATVLGTDGLVFTPAGGAGGLVTAPSVADFPAAGEPGKVYLAEDSGDTFRFDPVAKGTDTYVRISETTVAAKIEDSTEVGRAVLTAVDEAAARSAIGAEDAALKGQANGYAPLDSASKIDATYLPSYVDDVLEFATKAVFPETGSAGAIYVDLSNGNTWRWSGTTYVQISDKVTSTGITDSTVVGRKLITPVDEKAARYALQLGDGYETINVRHYGARGNGIVDDTAAIEAAWEAAGAGGCLFFPAGSYVYNGAGLDSPTGANRIRFYGAGNSSTRIILGASSYFIKYSALLASMVVSELTFSGGKGAIRHTFSGANVAGHVLIQNCTFSNYTECAIATESADFPYWHISDCFFTGANTTTTIGVALSAGTDQCTIDSCSFVKDRVHVKARRGNNLHITNTDFLQFSSDTSGGPRAAVWIVPHTSSSNAGSGMTISRCKFGNEGLATGDYRILYADDDAIGTSTGTKMPKLDADSTGVVTGHNIFDNLFVGTTANLHPLIYSTTPNVRDFQVHNNILAGGQPSFALQFRTVPTASNRNGASNVFGPFTGSISTEYLPFPMSNAHNVGYLQDPQAINQLSNTIRTWDSGSSASYKEIVPQSINTFEASATASDTAVPAAVAPSTTDVYGGNDAVTWTMSTATATLSTEITAALTVGLPLWIEFDIANPNDGKAASDVFVSVLDDPTFFQFRRTVDVPSVDKGWVTHAFAFTPRKIGQVATRMVFSATGAASVGKTVKIGRVRVYHANERQLGGRRPAIAAAATTSGGAAATANDLRNKLIGLGLVSGAPSTGAVVNDAVTGSSAGTATALTLWTGTKAQYDAIATKSATTIYVVSSVAVTTGDITVDEGAETGDISAEEV